MVRGRDGPSPSRADASAVGADDDVLSCAARTRTGRSRRQTLIPGLRRSRPHLEDRHLLTTLLDVRGATSPPTWTRPRPRRRFPPGTWLQDAPATNALLRRSSAHACGPRRRRDSQPVVLMRTCATSSSATAGRWRMQASDATRRRPPAGKSIAARMASRPACCARPRWAWCCAGSRNPRRTSMPP